MIGIGTPSNQRSMPRPIVVSIFALKTTRQFVLGSALPLKRMSAGRDTLPGLFGLIKRSGHSSDGEVDRRWAAQGSRIQRFLETNTDSDSSVPAFNFDKGMTLNADGHCLKERGPYYTILFFSLGSLFCLALYSFPIRACLIVGEHALFVFSVPVPAGALIIFWRSVELLGC